MNRLWGTLLAAAAVAFSTPSAASAQTSPGSPAMAVTYLEVVPSAEAETMRLLREVAAASRKEAGNLRFEVLQRIERPAHFAIIEAWADSKTFESHGANAATKTFRLMGPDETASNRLDDVFQVTDRVWMEDIGPDDVHLAHNGRVMEVLSEHLCQGWLEGYLLTGRHGFFSCYEAFIHIVDSMFNQHAKWLESTHHKIGRAHV